MTQDFLSSTIPFSATAKSLTTQIALILPSATPLKDLGELDSNVGVVSVPRRAFERTRCTNAATAKLPFATSLQVGNALIYTTTTGGIGWYILRQVVRKLMVGARGGNRSRLSSLLLHCPTENC